MKLCAAQLRPNAGDIDSNFKKHRYWIDCAVDLHADLIFFPELSLTGYEPALAGDLAIRSDDPCLDEFQAVSDSRELMIGVGAPLATPEGIEIGMIFFQPGRPRLAYSKLMLHSDEEPYFVRGKTYHYLRVKNNLIAPAICYESLQAVHADSAANAGADIYLASVAKSEGGIAKANNHYPVIAARHSMTVLMANCLGKCDDFVAAGQSAVWNHRGEFLGRLNDREEGIILYDMATEKVAMFPVS